MVSPSSDVGEGSDVADGDPGDASSYMTMGVGGTQDHHHQQQQQRRLRSAKSESDAQHGSGAHGGASQSGVQQRLGVSPASSGASSGVGDASEDGYLSMQLTSNTTVTGGAQSPAQGTRGTSRMYENHVHVHNTVLN